MNPNKVLWEKGDFTRIANTCSRTSYHLPFGNNYLLKLFDIKI